MVLDIKGLSDSYLDTSIMWGDNVQSMRLFSLFILLYILYIIHDCIYTQQQKLGINVTFEIKIQNL